MKFYWNTATSICWQTVYSQFCVKIAELSLRQSQYGLQNLKYLVSSPWKKRFLDLLPLGPVLPSLSNTTPIQVLRSFNIHPNDLFKIPISQFFDSVPPMISSILHKPFMSLVITPRFWYY